MKILKNSEYYRLKSLEEISNNTPDTFPIELYNKELELKLEKVRNDLVDLHTTVKTGVALKTIRGKIDKIIDFIERGKIK